jgi:O-antigen/teichoic acid export membrane protein
MVKVLLTEKWLGAVPYIRIICLDCLMWPLSAKLQAFNALGKSGLSLKISLFSKALGLVMMLIFTKFSPVVFAAACLPSSVFAIVLGGVYSVHILNYKVKDQIMDVLPTIIMSFVSIGVAYPLVYVGIEPFLLLALQILVAILAYISISAFTRNESFVYILQLLKDKFIRKEG